MPLISGRTLGEWDRAFREGLISLHGANEAKAIARAAFRHLLGKDPLQLDGHTLLTKEQSSRAEAIQLRLVAGEPLQYVLGTVLFHGLELAVDPRVLIPRPETEELVDLIIHAQDMVSTRIVDVCTGSGCIALALKQAFTGTAVTGCDISDGALDVARSNSATTGLDVAWKKCDALGAGLNALFTGQERPGRMLVVSNPPYVPQQDKLRMDPHVLLHEPHLALFVEDTDPHLFYRAIAKAFVPHAGVMDELWFEAHHLCAPATADEVRSQGFSRVEVLKDLSGNPRFIRARK
ncbi:MAG: peptide chain release factor N(5)-glutamine methyltransferase [Flavobacteriales bacterium]|nr:peptide chain release factor N(5)-glutamine methyltransferase [Flavobacteriales bacterium]